MNWFVGLVLLRVRDSCIPVSLRPETLGQFQGELTSAAGGELHITPPHTIKRFPLLTLGALLDHAVTVRELAVQNVAEYLRIAMRMRREPIPRGDPVLV